MLGRQPGLAGAEQRREGSRQCGNRERECETKHELLIGRRQRLLDLRSQIPETELQDLALRECARHATNPLLSRISGLGMQHGCSTGRHE